jgi:hypothetical protein
MDNEASYRRKSKEDSTGGGSATQAAALQQPLEAAALWSLCGVGAVVQNQWAASFYANARLAQRLFAGLHQNGLQLGAALAQASAADAPPLPAAGPAAAGAVAAGAARATADLDSGEKGTVVVYAKARAMYNPVVYGLPAVYLTGKK